jgi:hypothetical protein
VIALRCSNRAALDLSARIDLRCADLWQQLDATQEALSEAMTHDGFSRTDNYRRLAERERQILRELEDWS